ncbi:hypothetical protein Agabi119p4_7800 [Agaricus bisporus var. burnettii]|uniref:CCHC-type domain-containing protein n=1 Tax=Agaricus bisporus var. burnettii TaxID=192524 RepID=A0A8H7C891_AGABI|nr:hypothetical protein Agabi119p4_7800 [Agaricus bisporus var. burnettii]
MSKFAPHKRSTNQPRASTSTVCQKCLQRGHFIYECKYERPYISRPSRTQQLENPKLLAKLKADAKPSTEVPEEFKNKSGLADKILEGKEKERLKEVSSDTEDSQSDSDDEEDRRRARSSSDLETPSDQETDSDESDSDSDSRSPRRLAKSRARSPERKRKRSRSPSSGSEGPRRRR